MRLWKRYEAQCIPCRCFFILIFSCLFPLFVLLFPKSCLWWIQSLQNFQVLRLLAVCIQILPFLSLWNLHLMANITKISAGLFWAFARCTRHFRPSSALTWLKATYFFLLPLLSFILGFISFTHLFFFPFITCLNTFHDGILICFVFLVFCSKSYLHHSSVPLPFHKFPERTTNFSLREYFP